MNGLSRAEIDALVGEVIRAEDAGPVALTTLPPPRPLHTATTRPAARARRRGRWLGGVVALVMLGVLARVVLGSELGTILFHSHSMLGGVPSHPTTYSDGSYTFLGTQPDGSGDPVGFDPCQPIPVQVNFLNATSDIVTMVRTTIAQINRASGLHLVYKGATQETEKTVHLTRTIVVSFDDAVHDPELTNDAGFGGRSWTQFANATRRYSTGGYVTLNDGEFNHYTRHAQAIVLAHEFGHALGLGHSQGNEVMNPGNYRVVDWGHGDLTGLAKLGQLPCH